MPASLLLVGCGNMGGALLSCWIEQDYEITVLSPDIDETEFANHAIINTAKTSDTIETKRFDFVILAVKPQILDEAFEGIRDFMAPETVLISIAAGKTLSHLEKLRDDKGPVIRAMPNTPAAIRAGITALCANQVANEEQLNKTEALFSHAGTTCWIDENLFDVVTALSGSGPAYVFYFMETLAQTAEQQGMAKDDAMAFARQTVIGASALAAAHPETSASQLRENVTSPGGTTAAALDVLMDGNLQDILNKAIDAATARGKELSKN